METFLAVAAIGLAIIAMFQTGGLRNRVRRLEIEFEELEQPEIEAVHREGLSGHDEEGP